MPRKANSKGDEGPRKIFCMGERIQGEAFIGGRPEEETGRIGSALKKGMISERVPYGSLKRGVRRGGKRDAYEGKDNLDQLGNEIAYLKNRREKITRGKDVLRKNVVGLPFPEGDVPCTPKGKEFEGQLCEKGWTIGKGLRGKNPPREQKVQEDPCNLSSRSYYA